METKVIRKNAVDLHREMYERRCRELKWFHGESLKQALERINTVRPTRKQPLSKPKKEGPSSE